MKNTKKEFVWIAINILLLISIFFIGEFYPRTQQKLIMVMRIYVVLACVFSAFFSFQRKYSKKFTRYTKMIAILWVIIGIFLIALFIMEIFNALPLLFLYIFFSPIVATFAYNIDS